MEHHTYSVTVLVVGRRKEEYNWGGRGPRNYNCQPGPPHDSRQARGAAAWLATGGGQNLIVVVVGIEQIAELRDNVLAVFIRNVVDVVDDLAWLLVADLVLERLDMQRRVV